MKTLRKIKKIKDLGLKIGTKKEAAWTSIKENLEQKQINAEIEIIINKTVIELAEKEIAKEKDL